MSTKNKSRDLTITRIYDAPVEAVWNAWTDPVETAKWWGPRGFTLTTHSKDLRPGGHWHYTMHGPDGTDYPNRTVYFEVEKHKRLVYDHGANEHQPALFRVTVNFKKLGEKTEMEMTMTCPTPEAAEQTKKFVKKAGGNATWDRLAEYLRKTSVNQDIFVLNRSFEAPIETVFRMWTTPKLFAQWLGPENSTMEYIQDDIAVGKTTFFKTTTAAGTKYGKMEYVKIEPPHRIEYNQTFCDENGKLIKHPFVPQWPDKLLTQVIFTREGEQETRVTVTWQPIGNVTEEELKTFIDMRSEMTKGWTEAFDKLEIDLADGQS